MASCRGHLRKMEDAAAAAARSAGGVADSPWTASTVLDYCCSRKALSRSADWKHAENYPALPFVFSEFLAMPRFCCDSHGTCTDDMQAPWITCSAKLRSPRRCDGQPGCCFLPRPKGAAGCECQSSRVRGARRAAPGAPEAPSRGGAPTGRRSAPPAAQQWTPAGPPGARGAAQPRPAPPPRAAAATAGRPPRSRTPPPTTCGGLVQAITPGQEIDAAMSPTEAPCRPETMPHDGATDIAVQQAARAARNTKAACSLCEEKEPLQHLISAVWAASWGGICRRSSSSGVAVSSRRGAPAGSTCTAPPRWASAAEDSRWWTPS